MTRIATILTLMLALVACQTITPPTPTPQPEPNPTPLILLVSGYTLPAFVEEPTLTLHGVTNTSNTTFDARYLIVRCEELGVDTWFSSPRFTLQPNQTTTIYAAYSSGYPVMVDADERCFVTVPAEAGQPEWIVLRR